MQSESLEFLHYAWYSVSLTVLLVWFCRGGWRFRKLDPLLFQAEEEEPEPYRTRHCEFAPSEPHAIVPDSVRAPWSGFELFDVLLVLLVYFLSSLILSSFLGFDTNAVKNHTLLYFSGLIGKQVFVSLVILLLVWRRWAGGLTGFGLRSGKAIRTMVRAIGFFIAATGCTLLVLEITRILCLYFRYPATQQHLILTLLSQNPPILDQIMMAITAAVGAPLLEELLFRGILQTYFVSVFLRILRRSRPIPNDPEPTPGVWVGARWLGITAAAALFGLMHLPNWQHVPALFVLGIYLGYCYERYDNLLIPIFMHCMFNLLPLAYTMVAFVSV